MADNRPPSNDPGSESYGPDDALMGPGAMGAEPVGLIDTPPDGQKSYSQGELVLRHILRHNASMTSVVILLIMVSVALSSIGLGPIPGWWDQSYAMSAQS